MTSENAPILNSSREKFTPGVKGSTATLCGLPHYRYSESLCTEPAGHYVRERDPHAGPLIIDGEQCGGLAWDEPTENPMTIQPGQIYYSLGSRHHPCDGPTRIKIVEAPETVAGLYHFGKATVVTLTENGREIRRRAIEATQLHASDTTETGAKRRTGYVLETP